jgi:hypothetical protein
MWASLLVFTTPKIMYIHECEWTAESEGSLNAIILTNYCDWPIQGNYISLLAQPFRRVLDPMHVLRFKFKFMPFGAWISYKLQVTGHYCAVGGDAVRGATITDHWQHACTTDICSFFRKVQSIVCGPWKIEQAFIYFLKGELKVESQNFLHKVWKYFNTWDLPMRFYGHPCFVLLYTMLSTFT